MKSTILAWLDSAGHATVSFAVLLFVAANVAGALAVVIRRDRGLVDRWTPRWLAANLIALALGAGGPLLIGALKLAVSALPVGGAWTPPGK